MRVQVQRIDKNSEASVGAFYIECEGECFTLEDEFRTKKVFSETRIPSGSYEIKLRCEGGHYNRYRSKLPDVHKTKEHGMLCITNADDWKLVNNGLSFQYILIHIGNSDDDTAGCILVGSSAKHPNHFKDKSTTISGSTDAYKKLYPKIANKILEGERVYIDIYDEGQMF